MSAVSCSSLLDRIGGSDKPKTQPKKTQPKKTQPKKSDVQSLIKQGIAYREAGELRKAITSFQKALEIEPKNAKAKQYLKETQQERDALVEKHLNQGIEHFTNEDLQDAMKEWDKVLELDPSNKKALEYKEKTQNRLDALKDK
jgi:tetratricopeptide (TPR) repeat protein